MPATKGLSRSHKHRPVNQPSYEAFPHDKKMLLKQEIVEAFERFRAAVTSGDKDYIRQLHILSKDAMSASRLPNVKYLYKKHQDYFIDGKDLDPQRIEPVLRFVERDSKWEEIFRLVRHTWSMPYSKGYGRRMRFVVFDKYHDAVIGILGFQSPPADLACRDDLFKYPEKQKLNLVNRTMDVYCIGAIPPYSQILGGKLVTGLVACDDIRSTYWRLYAGKRTVMNNEKIEQPLVAVTTTSAFGKSSIYNRLKYKGRLLAEPIGYTKGYGTIHLETLYPTIIEMLRAEPDGFTSGGYGNGPKIRWQNFARALSKLGLPYSYFEHGLQREVFLFRFVENLESGMAGGQFGSPLNLRVSEFADYWKERWALPRTGRVSDWKNLSKKNYFDAILKHSDQPKCDERRKDRSPRDVGCILAGNDRCNQR